MSYEYSIKSLEEAEAYLENDYLRDNLYELCNILLTLEKDDAYEIFGSPDHMKLKSSMTLFDFVMPSDIFERVLEKFFHGERCLGNLQSKRCDKRLKIFIQIFFEHNVYSMGSSCYTTDARIATKP
jgi:hypothetical protein